MLCTVQLSMDGLVLGLFLQCLSKDPAMFSSCAIHCTHSTAIMTGATAVIEAQGSSTAPPGRGAGVSPVSDYDTTGATDKTTTMPDIASVHAPDKPASMFRAKLLYVPFSACCCF